MFISSLSQSYLVAYGSFTLIMVVALTLFNIVLEADMGWDINEDDYFNIARAAGLIGLATFALYLVVLASNGVSKLENTYIAFSWDIVWVTPAATLLGTITAPVLALLLTKIFKITFSITGTLTKTTQKALYHWCSMLSRIGTHTK